MVRYEYKVIPAPTKGRKAPGVKRPEARFALGLEATMNEAAAQGWNYLRADILPSEERQGLTSSHTVYRSVLVFRRALAEAKTTDALVEAAAMAAVAAENMQDNTPEDAYDEDLDDFAAPDDVFFDTSRARDEASHHDHDDTSPAKASDADDDDPHRRG